LSGLKKEGERRKKKKALSCHFRIRSRGKRERKARGPRKKEKETNFRFIISTHEKEKRGKKKGSFAAIRRKRKRKGKARLLFPVRKKRGEKNVCTPFLLVKKKGKKEEKQAKKGRFIPASGGRGERISATTWREKKKTKQKKKKKKTKKNPPPKKKKKSRLVRKGKMWVERGQTSADNRPKKGGRPFLIRGRRRIESGLDGGTNRSGQCPLCRRRGEKKVFSSGGGEKKEIKTKKKGKRHGSFSIREGKKGKGTFLRSDYKDGRIAGTHFSPGSGRKGKGREKKKKEEKSVPSGRSPKESGIEGQEKPTFLCSRREKGKKKGESLEV